MSLLSAVLQEADKASSEELKIHYDKLLPTVKDLAERIQLFTFDLQQNFIELFVNFSPTKSIEQLNYNNRKANILSDFSELIKQIEDLRLKYGAVDEEFMGQHEKLNNSMKVFKEMCILVEAKRVLEKADHESRRYNNSEAILCVKNLQKQLKTIKCDDKLEKGLSTLKARAQNQLSVYIALVSTEWEEIFKWTEKKSVLYLTYCLSVQQSDPLLIQRVLKTLYSSERMNAELGQFSHFFIDKLLHSVIRHNCEIYIEDHLGALEFNIKIDLSDKKKPNYQTIFNNLTAIFEFLENTLGSQFESDRKFIEVFADSVREKFFNKIIDDCIKFNLPSCDSTYDSYKNIVVELDCFNKFLIDIRFVEVEKSPLNKYIDHTDTVLYDKKCAKLLKHVRSLLSESLLNSKDTVGIDPSEENESVLDVSEKESQWDLNKPIFLPKCEISQSVKKIMSLIVEHLEESLKLPEKYQKQLVLTIKNIAVMYQTLVPAKFKCELESCPWAIALFFNNCFYLAHGLVGPPWKITLPADLADMLMTVLLECIQDLRVLALEKMSLFLQKKKDMISERVGKRDDTEEGPWTMKNFETFDIAVNETLCFLSGLQDYWLRTLPSRMYEMALSTLIQTLCQSVIIRIFEGHFISEPIAYMLEQRLCNAYTSISSYFSTPKEQLVSKISSWVKFSKLHLLMRAQLQEIAKLWYEDKEIQEHYTCEEVRQLIRMRFQDTPYRLKILQEIQYPADFPKFDALAGTAPCSTRTAKQRNETGRSGVSLSSAFQLPDNEFLRNYKVSVEMVHYLCSELGGDLAPQTSNGYPVPLKTAFLIITLVIVVNNGQGVTIEDDGLLKSDQVAEETKRNALTLIDGPKYVPKPEPTQPPPTKTVTNNRKPEQRPPSKPPIFPDKPGQQKFYVDIQRPPFYGNIQNLPRPQFPQQLKLFPSPNAVYNFPKVIPLPHHKNLYYIKQQPRPVVAYANNNKTVVVTKPPKFSIPVQTVKGVRKDNVKPPKINVSVGTTTVASLTTTKRYLRTKRIWPKKVLERMNATLFNSNKTTNYTNPTNITHKSDYDQSASITRIRYIFKNDSLPKTSPTRRPYRPVTRVPRKRSTTPAINITGFENSDWVPIVPSHYTKFRRPSHSRKRRSAGIEELSPLAKRMLYLQSYGIIPVPNVQNPQQQEIPDISRKKMVYFKKKRQLNPYYTGYGRPGIEQYVYGDLQAEGSHSHKHSHHPRVITKVKHHHHHHHHRYVKTVEKPVKVPYKVEVPKPYPVTVEKKVPVPVEKIKVVEKPVPYPVTVEKKVPYPIGIKVPHPVPYKVVEKEYVPKPYPVVHHVPVTVEKKVPYPVEVRVPVDRPVHVTVEKQVPYPVPVRVLVPQPYPVETKVPYPVQVKVKEPVEVIKHVPVKVPFPQPFAVKVPVPVEKKVPYPVEVEKRVPVPVEIYVPQKVEVEKKVPVYIPKPYPVEKKVPVPVKVPYPVEVPIYVRNSPQAQGYNDYYGSYGTYSGVSVAPNSVTSTPEHTVTVHGNTGFTGFQSRSDNSDTASEPGTATAPVTASS